MSIALDNPTLELREGYFKVPSLSAAPFVGSDTKKSVKAYYEAIGNMAGFTTYREIRIDLGDQRNEKIPAKTIGSFKANFIDGGKRKPPKHSPDED